MTLYIIKLSISLSVVYGFYHVFLRKLTFYQWNRWYLLGYSLLSFFIPLIDINPFLEVEDQAALLWVPTLQTHASLVIPSKLERTFWQDPSNWITLIGCLGIVVGAFRFFRRWISLMNIRSRSEKVSYGDIQLYRVTDPIVPFSFGKSIYVNPTLHDTKALEEILRHEFVHVRQHHTMDLIWTEIVTMLNWYNPFAWLLRHAIRQNLEFIADQHVLGQGINKKEYQYLLLQVMGTTAFSMGVPFNLHSLKKRISMMNQMRTAKVHLLKFLFLLPLLSLLLLSFRTQQLQQIKQDTLPKTVTVTVLDTLPGSADKKVIVIKRQLDGTSNEILTENIVGATEVNPSPNAKGYILSIANNSLEEIVIVKNAEGRIAKAIPLKEWNDNARKYEHKYGMLPTNKKVFITVMGAPGIDEGLVLSPLHAQMNDVNMVEGNTPGSNKKTFIIRSTTKDSLNKPLIILDGLKLAEPSSMKDIHPDQIASIEIIKNEKGIATFGDAGKNGVIVITSKKRGAAGTTITKTDSARSASQQEPRLILPTDTSRVKAVVGYPLKEVKEVRIQMDGQQNTVSGFNGLYVLDGKEYTTKQFEALNLNPSKIESINVLKGAAAKAVYGDKGKEGVIVIKLKSEK